MENLGAAAREYDFVAEAFEGLAQLGVTDICPPQPDRLINDPISSAAR